jgi:hypothetical protein
MTGKPLHVVQPDVQRLEVGSTICAFSTDMNEREEALIVAFVEDDQGSVMIVTAGNFPTLGGKEIFLPCGGRRVGIRTDSQLKHAVFASPPEPLCFSFFTCEVETHCIGYETNQIGSGTEFELADRVVLHGGDGTIVGMVSCLDVRAHIDFGNGISGMVSGLTLARAIVTESGELPILEHPLGRLVMTDRGDDEPLTVIGAVIAMNDEENYVLIASVAELLARTQLLNSLSPNMPNEKDPDESDIERAVGFIFSRAEEAA